MSSEIAVLESEGSIYNVSKDDIRIRRILVEYFRKLPDDFFAHLRHLQPQTGCLNRCSFCSQNASATVWYLNERGLRNLFSALKTVAIEVARRYITSHGKPYITTKNILSKDGTFAPEFQMPATGLVGFARTKRPGVVYCYYDDDPGYYPFLDKYLQYAYEDLGLRVRISTVGYSRHNKHLQLMHQRINSQLIKTIAGVRLSITPYTYGWTAQGEELGVTSRSEFIEDIANFLKTYWPAVSVLGSGEKTACVEFRFPPLIVADIPVTEYIVLGHHVIHAGSYILIGVDDKAELHTAVAKVAEDNSLEIDGPLYKYIEIISDNLINVDARDFAKHFIERGMTPENLARAIIREVQLARLENDDGIYYAVDPMPCDDGYFAKQIYPATVLRPFSGYIDSERYFLNTLLAYKRKKLLARRDPFPTATWQDVYQVLTDLDSLRKFLKEVNYLASEYIDKNIIPLVKAYVVALEKAGYPPSFFFDPGFTIDTGIICNLGRAFYEFRPLASRPNLPLTPNHERAYGFYGKLSKEGVVWRLSVAPFNPVTRQPGLLIEELDLRKRASFAGSVIRRFIIPFPEDGIETISISRLRNEYLIPGQRTEYVKGGVSWAS